MRHKRIVGIGLSALMLVSLCAVCASTGVMAATSGGGTQAAQAKSTGVVGAPMSGGLLFLTGPAVTSWAPGRLDVFVVGSDNALWHASWQNGWSSWESLGGYLTSSPAAVSWGQGRIDIFARGNEGHTWHLWWQNGWGTWEDLGGQLLPGTGPAVSSWASGRLDLFAIGANDHQLWHRAWTGTSWANWEPLNGYLTSSPAAVSWGQGRIDIFARGNEGHIWHLWWQNGWGTWEDLGGQLAGGVGPAVSSWAPGRLDVFVVGANDRNLWHKAWTGSSWTAWEDLNGLLGGSPGAVSWGNGRIDVFARGGKGDAWHLWFQNGWGNWEDVGAPLMPTQIVGFSAHRQPGQPVTNYVQGYLKDQNGHPVSGETVSIYYGLSQTNLNSKEDVTTSAYGSFYYVFGDYSYYYQARFAGDSTYAASQSAIVQAS